MFTGERLKKKEKEREKRKEKEKEKEKKKKERKKKYPGCWSKFFIAPLMLTPSPLSSNK